MQTLFYPFIEVIASPNNNNSDLHFKEAAVG